MLPLPPSPETTFNPIDPGALPCPLFQWYVVIDARQYVFLPVENVAGLPPFWTPPPFELSNSVVCAPEHRVRRAAGNGGDDSDRAAAARRRRGDEQKDDDRKRG